MHIADSGACANDRFVFEKLPSLISQQHRMNLFSGLM